MKVAVIGVGNDLMGDDAIGPIVIRNLRKLNKFPPNVELIEEGTGGMRIIHDMEGYDKVLIIDAANIERAPGEYKMFRPEDVVSKKVLSGRSIHEMDLLKALELALLTGNAPPVIWIMAIQPRITVMGAPVSYDVKTNIKEYIRVVILKVFDMMNEK
ncbi:MAG: hydrogenase maturation protease [Thermoplasmatota archaeon]